MKFFFKNEKNETFINRFHYNEVNVVNKFVYDIVDIGERRKKESEKI